jgi:hypothetical protein
MRMLTIALGLISAAVCTQMSHAQVVDDPFSDYLQRSVTISLGAGNAKDANAAIHTIHPWPPYVGDKHIYVQGRQAVDSVERMYRFPAPFQRSGSEAGGAGNTAGQTGTSTNGTGAPVTPVQPITSGD